MTGGDPNGWRRAYVEASAAAPEPGPVGVVGRFLIAFLVAFAPLYAVAEVMFP